MFSLSFTYLLRYSLISPFLISRLQQVYMLSYCAIGSRRIVTNFASWPSRDLYIQFVRRPYLNDEWSIAVKLTSLRSCSICGEGQTGRICGHSLSACDEAHLHLADPPHSKVVCPSSDNCQGDQVGPRGRGIPNCVINHIGGGYFEWCWKERPSQFIA